MYSIKKSAELKARREKAMPRGPFHVTPLFIARGEGALVYDIDGNEYVDFSGGIGSLNAGHCPPEVVTAIREQSGEYIHSCFNVMMYEPAIALAEKLNRIVPGKSDKQTLFFNSGAEAVENAVKIARYATGREAIIAFEHAFHGRTLLAMSLTSKVKPYKYGFGPFAPEIYRAQFPYDYRDPIGTPGADNRQAYRDYFTTFFKNHVAAEKVAAIIIEPVLGEGGFVVPPFDFIPTLNEICQENDILLIADEVQSGFCRTGKMFAMEHFKVEADLMVLGKSLASGMPLSAVTGKTELMNAPHVGGLGGTYAGNPVACRAALATIDVYEQENLAERSAEIGKQVKGFFQALQKDYDTIGDIRGLGAMVGIEFVTDRASKTPNPQLLSAICQYCYEHGLIIMSAGTYSNVLRTLMPLVITDDQLESAFSIIQKAIKEAS